jgi:hypothetical protein
MIKTPNFVLFVSFVVQFFDQLLLGCALLIHNPIPH